MVLWEYLMGDLIRNRGWGWGGGFRKGEVEEVILEVR